MEHETGSERPAPRLVDEIFTDLRALSQSDGALHEISAIIYRDWIVTVDTQKGCVVDDPEHRWSTSKLNKNELMLLVGLAVQSESDCIFSVRADDGVFAPRADQLLREFHDRILIDSAPAFDKETGNLVDQPDLGLLAREAIYYGAESFYQHQFSALSRQRYRNDLTWLLQNAGVSIRPMVDIARFIADRVNRQMTALGQMRKEGHIFNHGDFTDSLLISKADVQNRFGEKASAFFKKFATPATNANAEFVGPFTVNQAAIAPLIDLGDHLYVPNQYRLFETIYESPFYWMMGDSGYCDVAAEHRGVFLEKTAARIFESVFGPEHVFENVTIRNGSKDIAGEVDVLVVYGEFVLVVQAKSKRVTLRARAGNVAALKADFEGAIQSPYRQALECIELIRDGGNCVAKDKRMPSFHRLPRFFPVVVLSDSFPASTFLSHTMLQLGDNVAPVIWDLGVLDCVARLLPGPIELLFYLKSRSEVFEKILSDSEYNFLGYHIRGKLALAPEVDRMLLERDLATVVDDYMIAADLDIKTERPCGILERLQTPIVSELLAALKGADPRIASVIVDLYDLSGAMLTQFSTRILDLRKDVLESGKAIKAFSFPTASGGLTYAVTKMIDHRALDAAEAIGAKHKYDTKRDRWYVILDSIATKKVIDGLLPLVWPWEENAQDAEASKEVGTLFKSWQEPTMLEQGLESKIRNRGIKLP